MTMLVFNQLVLVSFISKESGLPPREPLIVFLLPVEPWLLSKSSSIALSLELPSFLTSLFLRVLLKYLSLKL